MSTFRGLREDQKSSLAPKMKSFTVKSLEISNSSRDAITILSGALRGIRMTTKPEASIVSSTL